jgi:hypothetical protein
MQHRTAALLAGLVMALAACADESRTPVAPEPGPAPLLSTGGTYSGSLSGAGDYDNQPNGTFYQSLVSGTHSGFLSGPGGPDFDLFLMKWNGSAWVIVASSRGSSATEQISYSGTSGYYVWQIYSYSGSGTYSFTMSAP